MTAVLLTLGLAACASQQAPSPAADDGGRPPAVQKPGQKLGKPYRVDGVWYHPRIDADYDETGIASWYGRKFHGRRTANGEVYDMDGLTAAHKTLPLPSDVQVTNLRNGKTAVLRVNDRGPFVNGRIIDVSRRAADVLGFRQDGTAPVRVQILPIRRSPSFIAEKPRTTEEERHAAEAAPAGTITLAALPPPDGVAVASAPRDNRTGAGGRDDGAQAASWRKPVLYVQAGSFAYPANAERLSRALAPVGPVKVTNAVVDGKAFYRVRVGPLAGVEEADRALASVIARGHSDARIVVE